MKFRTNFVTNSSSYSSAEIKIDNPVLLEILSKYKEMGAFACEDALGYDQSQCFCVTEEEAGDYFGYNSTSGNKKKKPSENKLAFCYMNPETADIYYAPKSIDEVASLIFDIIDEGELKDTALFEQCREEVSKRLDEINNAYISVDWHASNDSYGEAVPDEDDETEWEYYYDLNTKSDEFYDKFSEMCELLDKAWEIFEENFHEISDSSGFVLDDGSINLGKRISSGVDPKIMKDEPEVYSVYCKYADKADRVDTEDILIKIFCETRSKLVALKFIYALKVLEYPALSAKYRIYFSKYDADEDSGPRVYWQIDSDENRLGTLFFDDSYGYSDNFDFSEELGDALNKKREKLTEDLRKLYSKVGIKYGSEHKNGINYEDDKSADVFTVVDGTITEYHPENGWYEGGRCEEYICKNIGNNAFEGTKIFSVDFGPGCESVGKEAFKNCSRLCEVNFSEFHTCFGEYSFENCKKLPSVIELNCPWLREIPEGMFKGCTSIKKVILPASIRKIGKYAFEGCTSLQEIVFKGILDEIGENAFEGCTLLKNRPEAGIEYGPDIWTELHKKFMYSQDGLLYKYLGRDKRVVLPREIDGTPITGVYRDAFNDSTQTEELIFSDGFEEIDLGHSRNENKFENLKYIYLPDSVSVIRERSFANCVNLRGLYIPASVEQIGDCAFAECPNLENVYLAGGKGIYASALNTSHSPRLVIRGEAKSLAQKYAKRANVPFVIDTRDRETIEERLLAEARGQVSDNDFWEYDETITPEKELKSVLKDIDEVYETLEIIPENSNQFSKYLKGITLHRFMKLVSEVYNKPLIPWLTENGYIKSLTDKEKLEFIYKKLKERYPEGSALPEKISELIAKNSDIIPTTFKKLIATVEGKSEKEWFTENGFLASAEAIKAEREKRSAAEKAEKASKAAEEKAIKAAAEKAALLESLRNVVKQDESVLTERYKAVLERTLEKLEEFYPEHKTYAMDALCSSVRENAVILSKDLGYNSVTEFLYAYGYEPISGAEVYELRKNCGYTPGNEPAIIKTRLYNTISKLNEYYPGHIIEGSLQKLHENLAYTIGGLWQWLGYEDATAFLAAYGFTYTAKAGGQVRVDPAAIIDELKRRYPEGTDMSVQQITADNKDLSIKTLNNTAHQLFGMKLSDYLYEQGILINPPRGYVGNKRPEKLTSVQPKVTESVAEEKIESTTEISVIPETKTETQVTEAVDVAESHADKDDETILKEYTELLTSRIGTYPKENISFEDLKFFNSDISFGALNRITIKLYGEKAIRYCQRMGFLDDISVESAVNNAKNTEDKIDEVEETKATDEATAAALKEKTEEKITSTNFNIKNGILVKYSGNAEDVTVPDGVVEIAGKAFAKNEFIKRIIAPESLRRIDNSAFADCTALEEVRVTDKVEYIGKEVFKGCSALKGFVIPGNVTAIFERTFDGCKAMEYLVVHEHVSYVDTFNWLFSPVYGAINDKVKHNLCRTDNKYKNGQLPHGIAMPVCTLTAEDFRSREFLMCGNELVEYSGKDETVIIPDGVKTIGSFAFSMLYGEDCVIKRILIPDSVSAIKRGAFDGQTKLQSIEFPYGVKAVNFVVASGCESLEYVTLPETATSIDTQAFNRCCNLKSINIPASVKKIEFTAFDNAEQVTIYGESGSAAEKFAKKKGITFRTGLPYGVPKPRTKDDNRYSSELRRIKDEMAAEECRKAEEAERQRLKKEAEEKARREAEERRSREAEERRIAEEKRVAEEKRIAAQRKSEYEALVAEKEQLLQTIAENKGLFGEKARRRKEAKSRLAEVEAKMNTYPEFNK